MRFGFYGIKNVINLAIKGLMQNKTLRLQNNLPPSQLITLRIFDAEGKNDCMTRAAGKPVPGTGSVTGIKKPSWQTA